MKCRWLQLLPACSTAQQQYTDDTQLYVALSHQEYSRDISSLEDCFATLHSQFCHNGLTLEYKKFDSILFTTRRQSYSCSLSLRSRSPALLLYSRTTSKYLGVMLGCHLTTDIHVNEISGTSNYHLRR
jgi:hypothetical protein